MEATINQVGSVNFRVITDPFPTISGSWKFNNASQGLSFGTDFVKAEPKDVSAGARGNDLSSEPTFSSKKADRKDAPAVARGSDFSSEPTFFSKGRTGKTLPP